MKDGTYKFYMFQHLTTAKTKHGDKDGPLVETGNTNWDFSNWDVFGVAIDPWSGTERGQKVYKKSSDDAYKCWSLTGKNGFFDFEFAMAALKRLRKADDAGEFNPKHQGYTTGQSRHSFRIMMIEVSQKTTMVINDDFIKAIDSQRDAG